MKKAYADWNIDNAINYNIFDILNIRFRETKTHTPFLVNLLKPKSSHGQQCLFYNAFLEQVFLAFEKKEALSDQKKDLFSKVGLNDIHVIEEKSTTMYGRIDILIRSVGNKEPFAIVIENKINAGDQKKQLTRYYKYCTKTLGLSDNQIILVYLTKEGKEASDTSMHHEKRNQLEEAQVLVNISYHEHINNMLEECFESIKSENVKILVQQYINIIKNI